jgi:hypothetical protein
MGEVDRDAGDEFGLGPRDQYAAVDREIEVAETPSPEHVLQGFAGAVPGDHRIEVGDHPLGDRLVEGSVVSGTVEGGRDLAQPPRLVA